MPPRLGILLLLGTALTGCDPAATSPPSFPCAVEAALEAKCRTCHTMPMRMGAPFALLEYAQTQMDYGSVKVWQAMKAAIESGFMPLAGSPTGPLAPDEKTALLDWLGAGAPPSDQPCAGGM
jgi:hypothetical protein